jgi:hypothetical protein
MLLYNPKLTSEAKLSNKSVKQAIKTGQNTADECLKHSNRSVKQAITPPKIT